LQNSTHRPTTQDRRQQKRAPNPNPPGLVVSQKVGSGLGSEFVWKFVRFATVEEVRHVVIFFSLPWPYSGSCWIREIRLGIRFVVARFVEVEEVRQVVIFFSCSLYSLAVVPPGLVSWEKLGSELG
jgi:hypothetical protein